MTSFYSDILRKSSRKMKKKSKIIGLTDK